MGYYSSFQNTSDDSHKSKDILFASHAVDVKKSKFAKQAELKQNSFEILDLSHFEQVTNKTFSKKNKEPKSEPHDKNRIDAKQINPINIVVKSSRRNSHKDFICSVSEELSIRSEKNSDQLFAIPNTNSDDGFGFENNKASGENSYKMLNKNPILVSNISEDNLKIIGKNPVIESMAIDNDLKMIGKSPIIESTVEDNDDLKIIGKNPVIESKAIENDLKIIGKNPVIESKAIDNDLKILDKNEMMESDVDFSPDSGFKLLGKNQMIDSDTAYEFKMIGKRQMIESDLAADLKIIGKHKVVESKLPDNQGNLFKVDSKKSSLKIIGTKAMADSIEDTNEYQTTKNIDNNLLHSKVRPSNLISSVQKIDAKAFAFPSKENLSEDLKIINEDDSYLKSREGSVYSISVNDDPKMKPSRIDTNVNKNNNFLKQESVINSNPE